MRNTVRLILALLFVTSVASAQFRPSYYMWRYYGSKDDSLTVLPKILTNPSLLESGAVRWNVSSQRLQVYDGSTWVDQAPGTGGAGYIWNGTASQTADFNITGGGRLGGSLGVGTVVAPTTAKIYSVSTTLPQLRLEYSTGNRMDITTGSTGSTSFNLTGTAPTFSFAQQIGANGGLTVTGNAAFNTVPALGTPASIYLTTNSGILSYRTSSQVLSDIGGAPSSGGGNYIWNSTGLQTATFNITGSGSMGRVSSSALEANSQLLMHINSVATANRRWAAVITDPESGGTSGSGGNRLDFVAYENDGDSLGIPLSLWRSGRVGINKVAPTVALDVVGSVAVSNIPALGTPATTFLTSNSGVISSRTAVQVLTDIGAIQNQSAAAQSSSSFWISGNGNAAGYNSAMTNGNIQYLFHTGSIAAANRRWGLLLNGGESGGNTGSNLLIGYYNDAGGSFTTSTSFLRDGKVGVNESAPSGQLEVKGTSASTGTAFRARNSTPATVFQVDNNGDVTLLNGIKLLTGIGTPEGTKTAPVGSMYLRTDGGGSSTLYIKESGTGNTGWMSK